MNLLKRFLNHPTMVLTNDLFAFTFVVITALGLGFVLFAAFVGAPCPECVAIIASPQQVIFTWVNGAL